MTTELNTILDLTQRFLDQDYRWSQILKTAEGGGHPLAPKVRAFLKGPWEHRLHQVLEFAALHTPEMPVGDRLRNEVLDHFHREIYPAADAVGLPPSSFVFPDIDLKTTVGANMQRIPVIDNGRRTIQHVLWNPDREQMAGHAPSFYVLGSCFGPGDFYLFDDPEHGDFTFEGRRFHRYQSKLSPMWEDPNVSTIAGEAPTGITFKTELDDAQVLHASICIDGKCYQGAIDLAPAIAAVMASLARKHAEWHKEPFTNPLPVAIGADVCEARLYSGVTVPMINAILKRLHEEGATITGNNPWNVVTHQHGVELRGTWKREAGTLLLEITDKDGWPVTCDRVWSKLEDDLQEVGVQVSSRSGDHVINAIDKAVRAAGDTLVGTLLERHMKTEGYHGAR